MDLEFRVPRARRVDPDAEERMLRLVNAERNARDLAPLVMDPALRQLAQAHAADMFQPGLFLAHGPATGARRSTACAMRAIN